MLICIVLEYGSFLATYRQYYIHSLCGSFYKNNEMILADSPATTLALTPSTASPHERTCPDDPQVPPWVQSAGFYSPIP